MLDERPPAPWKQGRQREDTSGRCQRHTGSRRSRARSDFPERRRSGDGCGHYGDARTRQGARRPVRDQFYIRGHDGASRFADWRTNWPACGQASVRYGLTEAICSQLLIVASGTKSGFLQYFSAFPLLRRYNRRNRFPETSQWEKSVVERRVILSSPRLKLSTYLLRPAPPRK